MGEKIMEMIMINFFGMLIAVIGVTLMSAVIAIVSVFYTWLNNKVNGDSMPKTPKLKGLEK